MSDHREIRLTDYFEVRSFTVRVVRALNGHFLTHENVDLSERQWTSGFETQRGTVQHRDCFEPATTNASGR